MFPFLKTKILSALWIVENLWAITTVVLFLIKLLIAFWTTSSDSASKDDVGSEIDVWVNKAYEGGFTLGARYGQFTPGDGATITGNNKDNQQEFELTAQLDF